MTDRTAPPTPARDRIEIRGARQHNLKAVDLDIPKGKLVVMTGVASDCHKVRSERAISKR